VIFCGYTSDFLAMKTSMESLGLLDGSYIYLLSDGLPPSTKPIRDAFTGSF